jgi:hypothetical protein
LFPVIADDYGRKAESLSSGKLSAVSFDKTTNQALGRHPAGSA